MVAYAELQIIDYELRFSTFRTSLAAVRAAMAKQNCLQAESRSELLLSVRNGEMSDIGGAVPGFGVTSTFRPFGISSSIFPSLSVNFHKNLAIKTMNTIHYGIFKTFFSLLLVEAFR